MGSGTSLQSGFKSPSRSPPTQIVKVHASLPTPLSIGSNKSTPASSVPGSMKENLFVPKSRSRSPSPLTRDGTQSQPVSQLPSPPKIDTPQQRSTSTPVLYSPLNLATGLKTEPPTLTIASQPNPTPLAYDPAILTKMEEIRAENQRLKYQIKELIEENKMLRQQRSSQVAQDLLVGPPRTVSVPPQFEAIFKKAEAEVAHFFSQKIEEPRSATISIMQDRYIILRGPAISLEFYNVIERMMGDGKKQEALEFVRRILYDLSYAIGRADCESFARKMCLTDPLVLLSAGTIQFAFRGWGFVSISEESTPIPTPEQFYLFYEHPFSFEAAAYIQQSISVPVPMCVMNAGYSAGWCSIAFNLDLCSSEVLCKAKGDPCCRFIMTHQSVLLDKVKTYQKNHPELPVHVDGSLPGFFRSEHELHVRAAEAEKMANELQKKLVTLAEEKDAILNKVTALYT